MNKGVWFLAGSALGAYGVTRARRAAEVLTYDGLHDRLSGLFVGARLFAAEFKQGAMEKETELRERLDLMPHGHPEAVAGRQRGEADAIGPLTLVKGSND
jgi:hypothetical protein